MIRSLVLFLQRMRHRLEAREVLSLGEFKARFPTGYPAAKDAAVGSDKK